MDVLRRILRKSTHFRTDDDLREELRIHIEMQTEEQAWVGVPRREAARRALVKLGSPDSVVRRVRDQEFATFASSLFRDVIFAIRTLRKSPVFTVTAVLTMAIGIAANTAIFHLLYGLMLRPLPVPYPSELARVSIRVPGGRFEKGEEGLPWNLFEQYRARQHSFASLSAWSFETVAMQDKDSSEKQYTASLLTGDAFSALGVKPYLGRLLTPADDISGGPAEGWSVVLSYDFWKDRFGGDPEVIWKPIRISNNIATIVGVLPPDFHGVAPGWNARIYLPLQFFAPIQGPGNSNPNGPDRWYFCAPLGLLKSGISIADANAEIAGYREDFLHADLPADFRNPEIQSGLQFRITPARTGFPMFRRRYEKPLILMQALVGVVLILCCVNLSGLMMSRNYARRREFAVRVALGGARSRLIRQHLTESFLIVASGWVLGTAVAWFGCQLLLRFFVDPIMCEGTYVAPDLVPFVFTAFAAIVAALLFGLVPAWRAGRAGTDMLLTSRTALGGRRQIAGRALVPVQVALSLVLVSMAGVLSQSIVRLRSQPAGFDATHVTIQTPLFDLLPQKGEALLDIYQKMVERLRQMPGIQSAAVTQFTPMTNFQPSVDFISVTPGLPPREDSHVAFNDVGSGYFRTMQTGILAGREFEKQDRDQSVCIVNQSAARFFFPGAQALGQSLRSNDSSSFPVPVTCRVVGVAEDAKFASMREPAPKTIYFPLTKASIKKSGILVFLMRSTREKDGIDAYRKVASEIVPSIPVARFSTMANQIDDSMGTQMLITLLSDLFAGLAVLLSAIGLYALLASSVAQRTNEIGVRIALGAQNSKVLRMVLADALILMLAGILLGSVLLALAVQPVQQMTYGVSALDPTTLMVTVVLLIFVALMAAFVPAKRAASVDPAVALRVE